MTPGSVGSESERTVCEPEITLSCAEGWRMQSNILRNRVPFPRKTYRELPGKALHHGS
jgi:hypothetical protein